ncbi:spermidine/putrescine ABC transporter substrate-binding protein [Aeromonas sp. MdU4]|uniref:spermidine/putrescine ABC transporter substrate-binding protein n=1 Tax=Aeromonas sp. MdU4 TaxID=3342819 RepID=UPI0035B6F124
MRLLSLCWLLAATPALAAPVQLKLLEWGYLPAGYEQQFADYARANGVEATVSRVEPLLTDFDSVYRALRTRSADVVIPTSYFYKAHHQPLFKLLLPIDFSRLHHYGEVKPALKNTEYDKQGERNYSVPLTIGMFSLAYDSKQVSEPPTSWRVLADSAESGQFAEFCDQFEPLLFSVLLSLGKSPALFASGEMLADQSLQQEVEQQLTRRLQASRGFWFNQTNRCEDLRQQTYATTWGLELVACNEQNHQQWRIARVQEGAIYALDALSIARHVADDPERLKAAYLLLDFLLSAPLQRQMLAGIPTLSASNIASRPPLSPQEQAVLPDRPLPAFDERLLVPALPAHIKNRYKRMVQQAISASGKESLSKQCPWDLAL